MSQKCNCLGSKFSPHRADKCTFARNKKKPAADAAQPLAPLPPHAAAEEAKESAQDEDLPVPPTTDSSNESDPGILNDFIFVGESNEEAPSRLEENATLTDPPLPSSEDVTGEGNASSSGADNLVPEIDEEAAAGNSTSQNGNEQCDCVAYRVRRHRKKNCKWKQHTIIGLVVAAGAIAAVALASTDGEDDLSAGVENINLNSPPTEEPAVTEARREEDERLRTEREEADRAAAERETEEREARLRAEEERRRLMAAQQAHMAAQERENQRLRAEILAAQRANQTFHQQSQQNTTYNQQSYQFHTTQHNTYSTSSYNAPSYNMTHNSRSASGGRSQVGTTLKGTPCKNCLKQGGRCHQHR